METGLHSRLAARFPVVRRASLRAAAQGTCVAANRVTFRVARCTGLHAALPVGIVGLVLLAAPAAAAGARGPRATPSPALARDPVGVCRLSGAGPFDPEPIPLRPTGPSVGFSGSVILTFARSPFGVAVSPKGHHRYDLRIQLETQRRAEDLPVLVAWVMTPDLQNHMKLGVVGEDLEVSGQVAWNKFLIAVSAEESADVETWQGPLLLTGMSPSGWMHTMAGHGIFEAGYGFC